MILQVYLTCLGLASGPPPKKKKQFASHAGLTTGKIGNRRLNKPKLFLKCVYPPNGYICGKNDDTPMNCGAITTLFRQTHKYILIHILILPN